MIEKSVSGKTAFKRVLQMMRTNPAYSLDNAAETLSIVFDTPVHVLGNELKKEPDGVVFSVLEVNWETALNRIINRAFHRYKEFRDFGSAEGIKALMIVFDLPKKTVNDEFKRERIRILNERSSSRMQKSV